MSSGSRWIPRLISSMSLITGALPAEYGLRTAGIIDITTKSGVAHARRLGVDLRRQPRRPSSRASNYGGGAGSFSYFVTGDFLRNDLGIESPDGSSNPIHDHTTQYHGFGYFEDILDERESSGARCSAARSASFRFPIWMAVEALARVDGRRHIDLPEPGSERESARGHAVRRLELAAFGRARSTCRPRSSRAIRA